MMWLSMGARVVGSRTKCYPWAGPWAVYSRPAGRARQGPGMKRRKVMICQVRRGGDLRATVQRCCCRCRKSTRSRARVAAGEAITGTLSRRLRRLIISRRRRLHLTDDDQFGPEAEGSSAPKIFDIDEVASMLEMHGGGPGRLAQLKVWATQMSRDGGYRPSSAFP